MHVFAVMLSFLDNRDGPSPARYGGCGSIGYRRVTAALGPSLLGTPASARHMRWSIMFVSLGSSIFIHHERVDGRDAVKTVHFSRTSVSSAWPLQAECRLGAVICKLQVCADLSAVQLQNTCLLYVNNADGSHLISPKTSGDDAGLL